MASVLDVGEAQPLSTQECAGSHRCYFSMGIIGPAGISVAQTQNCCPATLMCDQLLKSISFAGKAAEVSVTSLSAVLQAFALLLYFQAAL